MGYSSPIAWVDSGHKMSDWRADMQEPMDPDIERAMASPPILYPVRHPVRDEPVGQRPVYIVSASELVGKFVV